MRKRRTRTEPIWDPTRGQATRRGIIKLHEVHVLDHERKSKSITRSSYAQPAHSTNPQRSHISAARHGMLLERQEVQNPQDLCPTWNAALYQRPQRLGLQKCFPHCRTSKLVSLPGNRRARRGLRMTAVLWRGLDGI